MSRGKLVVIEGMDGAGKTTQLNLLCGRLDSEGRSYRRLEYPRYDKYTGAVIKEYLSGAFGSDPDAVNPYAASSFYAVDRVASYLEDWKEDYRRGMLFVSGRYTTSNAIHQCAKLPSEKRDSYLNWLFDYEYGLLELPKPDAVVFLRVPHEIAAGNVKARGLNADIHERDADYERRCAECALDIALRYGWIVINCAENGKLLPPNRIHDKIFDEISVIIN